MSIRLPHSAWQWFVFFVPAIVTLVSVWLAPKILAPLPRLQGHPDLMDVSSEMGRWFKITFSVLLISSLVIAPFFSGGSTLLGRVASVTRMVFLIFGVNLLVCFGGCAVTDLVRSMS